MQSAGYTRNEPAKCLLQEGFFMKWPERLRQVRQQRSLKQRELAELVHVSAQTIYDIESGRRRAHAELVAQLAQALRVSADYLLGISDDPNPNGLQDEPAGLKKIFWALKDDALLAALAARYLGLPREARLSVLEHWEMDLFIEEKRASGKAGKKHSKHVFPAAVHEGTSAFNAKRKMTAEGAAGIEDRQWEDPCTSVLPPDAGRTEPQSASPPPEDPDPDRRGSHENKGS